MKNFAHPACVYDVKATYDSRKKKRGNVEKSFVDPFGKLTLPEGYNDMKSLSYQDGWQLDHYNQQKDSRLRLIVGPCGCGKTVLMQALAYHDVVIAGDCCFKTLISPPQTITADNFQKPRLIEIGGVLADWTISPNQNFVSNDDSKVDRLIEWLFTSAQVLRKSWAKIHPNGVIGLVAVATQANVATAWKVIEEGGDRIKRILFKMGIKTNNKKLLELAFLNLGWMPDESHHLNFLTDWDCHTEEEIQRHKVLMNYVSQAASFMVQKSSELNTRLTLTTATPFRGDTDPVISACTSNKFTTTVRFPHEHYPISGINNIDFLFREYRDKEDLARQFKTALEAEPNEYHWFGVPSYTHQWRKRENDWKFFYDIAVAAVGRESVLELITKNNQDRNKRKLLEDNVSSDPKIKVIIGCMLGIEGTDWVRCSRVHNSRFPERSLVRTVQFAGRSSRPATDKNHIKIIHYSKKLPPLNNSTPREYFSDVNNRIIASMEFGDMVSPILIKKKRCKNNTNTNTLDTVKNSRGEYFTLRGVFSDVKKASLEVIEKFECQENKSFDKLLEICKNYVHEPSQNVAEEYKERAAKGLYIRLERELLKLERAKINKTNKYKLGESDLRANYNIDLITEENDGQFSFYAAEATPETFKLINKILRDADTEFDANVEELKKYGVPHVLNKFPKDHKLYKFVVKWNRTMAPIKDKNDERREDQEAA